MEAVFGKDTGELFSCVGSAAAPGKSFYCPSTPHKLNTNNKVAVLTPSNSILQSDPLAGSHPPKQQVSLSTTLTAQPYSTHAHSPPPTYMYYESWPTSCSSQQTPPTIPQAPPTTNSQWSCCDKDVSVERGLLIEKEEERRPSLARLVERFRIAAPTSREERGNMFQSSGKSTPFHSTPQSSDITPSTPHNNGSLFADPSPHVSDNSLDSRSQGLINRGSSLISPSSTMSSTPPANNYFNSKRETNLRLEEDIVPTGCLCSHLNAASNDQVPSPRTGSKVASRCFVGSVNIEEDILYQWRLRRKLEEARREAKSEGTKAQVHTDASMETGVPGMGTGPDGTEIRIGSIATKPDSIGMGITCVGPRTDGAGMGITTGIGTGLDTGVTEPMLATDRLAGAAVTEHEGREKDIGTLKYLGVVRSSSSSREEHGGVKSTSTSTSSCSSSTRVSKKDEVVGTDCSSHSSAAKEEQHTIDKQPTSTNAENLTPLNQQQWQGEEATKNQNTIPPSSKGPEAGSSSNDIEGEPETAPVNQSIISESTLTSVSQLNQPTTVAQVHTPSLHGDGNHGNDELDLEGGVGVEESSYWTITPCGSPDSGQTSHSLGPLINEVVGDRLFDHHSSATSTPSKTTHQATLSLSLPLSLSLFLSSSLHIHTDVPALSQSSLSL